MSIALILPDRDPRPLATAIRKLAPELAVHIPPQPIDDAKLAVLWQQPAGALSDCHDLRAVMSMGAGVEFIVSDTSLPEVPIGRVTGARLGLDISHYVLAVILAHSRQLERYQSCQTQVQWLPESQHLRPVIGVLGLGEIGARVAQSCVELGFPVHGWRASGGEVQGVRVHRGSAGLNGMLGEVDYLVNTLPLTEATRDLLNRERFSQCKKSCWLINVGRGDTVVDDDLLAALDSGQLSGATLDVFRAEPLPPEHRFWTHPRVHITPHVAALTDTVDAATQIVESYRRVLQGLPPLNPVVRNRGY